jgi:hypothetical protein
VSGLQVREETEVSMRLFGRSFVLVFATAVCVMPLCAQAPGVPATLDAFLDKHPNIESDLEKNPSLLNNADYLTGHPDLKAFLGNHPTIQEQAAKNPQALMHREEKFDNSGRDITKSELANFDSFLDKHPNIEKDMEKNPNLLTNADYLAKHPELKTFLSNHPRIQREISEHPRTFVKAERKFDRREDKREKKDGKVGAKTQPKPIVHPTDLPKRKG